MQCLVCVCACVARTSWDPASALARGAGDTVPSSEFHVGELGHVSATLPIIRLLWTGGQAVLALVMTTGLRQVGQRLPHGQA